MFRFLRWSFSKTLSTTSEHQKIKISCPFSYESGAFCGDSKGRLRHLVRVELRFELPRKGKPDPCRQGYLAPLSTWLREDGCYSLLAVELSSFKGNERFFSFFCRIVSNVHAYYCSRVARMDHTLTGGAFQCFQGDGLEHSGTSIR